MNHPATAAHVTSHPHPHASPDASGKPVILFDGVCNLCNASVTWVIERDPDAIFDLAALQSEAARDLLGTGDLQAGLPDSIVLVDAEGVHVESEAALRIASRLGFPYRLLAAGRLVPRPLRDAVYRLVARNRYRWFGRRDACMVPTPDVASRFLDADEARTAAPPGHGA